MDDSKWMPATLDLLSKMHCDLLAPEPHYDIPKVGPRNGIKSCFSGVEIRFLHLGAFSRRAKDVGPAP